MDDTKMKHPETETAAPKLKKPKKVRVSKDMKTVGELMEERYGKKSRKAPEPAPEQEPDYSAHTVHDMYIDTEAFIDIMEDQYPFYPQIFEDVKNGNAEVEVKKRYMLKAIDEVWINEIEDCLPALDKIIRQPSRFIQENEEVMPIELSRNISSRSIQHLCQHSDYISKVDGDDVMPSKILNVFRDETLLTYENKFVNTLINRLFAFVEVRYDTAVKEGKDEKTSTLNFSEEFAHGDVNAKIHFNIEISEDPQPVEHLKNYTYTTDLWQRVIKIHKIVCGYHNSEFVREMRHTYIRPPVIRTNAILKNKNLRKCLELWEFIESYENIGYNMLIQENREDVNSRYIQQLYSYATLQYILFRHNIKNEFDAEHELDNKLTKTPLAPTFVDEADPDQVAEFNRRAYKERRQLVRVLRQPETKPGVIGKYVRSTVDIALDADNILRNRTYKIQSPVTLAFSGLRGGLTGFAHNVRDGFESLTETARQIGQKAAAAPSKPEKPAKPVKPTQPAETASRPKCQIESGLNPRVLAETVQTIKAAHAAKPAKPANSAKLAKPTKTEKAAKQAKPAKPPRQKVTKPLKPTKHDKGATA